jgi:DNA-binding winged helix-turn-helix (wHTH) protein/tetratricopeptide (TPR) repeat protein
MDFYDFGEYRVDLALSRLQRGRETIPLPPKAFDLLVLLVRNTGRVIPKQELMQSLWPDSFVEDANLTQHIYTLRRALGDGPDGVPYVETVPRRGYRLAANVHTEATSPASTPVISEGERKRATVLHCALADAQALAERLGSIEMYRFVERIGTAAQEEAARYGGVITQRLADGFVAIFGAREVHEDDAQRAILTARAIERRLVDFNRVAVDDDAIALTMGIATGPLVINRVTDDRGVRYVAVGDTLRAATALQQSSAPGSIALSDATRRATEKRPRTTFVGRQHELFLLEGLFEHAHNGQGQVVGIVGDPGVGKSRLVLEAAWAMRRGSHATIVEGRCVSYGSLVPYLPLIDILRAYCDVVEGDAPEALQRAIADAVRDNGLPHDAGAWLLRLIGILDEATAREASSPEAVKARTFDALRLLVLRAASSQPLVIVVEDVHWIDRTSEEFLALLIGHMVAARILLIVTYRPGYSPPWSDRSYATQITIAPLNPSDSARLLASVAGGAATGDDVSRAILERGEGNPLFLEELACAVSDQAAASIPETVQGVIMARLDRLPDVAKRVLQTASVVGRDVPLRVLTRVWGSPDIAGEMAELCRQEFLYQRPADDDGVYVFKHALTQDVAYDSLLARRRRDLHLATARALEEFHADRLDEISATLAYHYTRTDLIDEAVVWLMRAGDQAARVYANTEAILHLDLAARRLQRVPEGADRDRRMLEVALRRAHSLYFLGRFRESVDALAPHAARVARLGDPALAARYAFWLAHMHSRLGDQRRAREHARRAIEAGAAAGDDATVGKAHGLIALDCHWSGEPALGIPHGLRAVELLERFADQRWWLGMAHFYLAMNYLITPNAEAARDAAARADAVGRDIGDPRLQTYAGFTAGWIEILSGHSAEAVTITRRSLEQAPDRVSRAYASMILGYALLETGEREEAERCLRGTITELESFGFLQWHGLAVILVGEARRRAGDLDEAARLTAAGREIAVRANYRYAIDLADRLVQHRSAHRQR